MDNVENKMVYDRMIALAADAKEKGVVVAFVFHQEDGSSDECYGAVVTNTSDATLLHEMLQAVEHCEDDEHCGCD